MSKRRDTIPGPRSRSIDGISRMPGRQIVKRRNWPDLKRRFLADPDYLHVTSWLHEVMMWTPSEIKSGATTRAIVGWGREKVELEHKKTEILIESMLEQQRKLKPSILQAKLALVQKIIKDVGRWDRLLPPDRKLCYEILKTELGEPTRIQNLGIGIQPKDPVEALLESYGLMKDGRIIIDAEPSSAGAIQEPAAGAGDLPADAAANSGSPAEISSNPAL